MENVWEIITKPDNIPIVGLLILLVFFTGIVCRQALKNDRQRGRQGNFSK